MTVAERFMRIDPPPRTYMYHLGLSGLLDLYTATGEQRLLDFVLAHRARHDGKRPGFDWRLYAATGDPQWLEGVKEAGEQWLADPRRDRDGALLDPRGRYTIDIVSGLATQPVIFGHLLKDHRYFDEAGLQLDIARGYLEEPVTGIWYSRWGHGLHPHRPNPGLWGRGNGWLVNAWGRVMHLWDPEHPRYAEVLSRWQSYCRANAAFQTDAGLFRQLMNRPASFEDATATGLIGAGIAHGALHGTLPAEMGAIAYRAALGLAQLVDDEGNIHNVSTTAGGYNFEQQYESCATFNEPHGDGAVMGCCAVVHRLLQGEIVFDRTPPAGKAVIVTRKVPGSTTFNQPDYRKPDEVAAPVLARARALSHLPALDDQGSVILGLLHWHDATGEAAPLEKARQLFDLDSDQLNTMAHWRLMMDLARREGKELPIGLPSLIDYYLANIPRDREGLLLDEHGGYDVRRLYGLLPLLGLAGAATGKAACFDEACAQLLGYQEWLEEPNTGLWHAAYGRGAHPRRVTPGFWALGNGYLLAGVVDLLDVLPREHANYVDVMCLLRGLAKALHEWLPVYGGWTQLLTDFRNTFPCVAANGLLTYGLGKAVWRGWINSAYIAAAWGGMYHLGVLVQADGSYGAASLPTGGLDTLEAYQHHRVENDPYALGLILSGCAASLQCAAIAEEAARPAPELGAR
jgi:rhamnogalacturonyl hydrolase YesR